MTVEEIAKLFDEINVDKFGGKVPKYRIVFNNRIKRFYAQVDFTYRRIEFAGNIDDEDVYDTLVHEMSHIFLWEYAKDNSHGRLFKAFLAVVS